MMHRRYDLNRHDRAWRGRHKAASGLGALVAVLLGSVAAGAQDGVVLDALVLDRAGLAVGALTVDDFDVTFAGDSVPVTRVRIVSREVEPRRFVFVVNRRGAQPEGLQRVKTGLEQFVTEQLGNRDEALFVDFAEVPRITAAWRVGPSEIVKEVQALPPAGFSSPVGDEQDAADATFMLEALAERLEGAPGRKVVVIFSRGLRIHTGEPGSNTPFKTVGGTWRENGGVPTGTPRGDEALSVLAHGFTAARASVYAFHLDGSRGPRGDDILLASREEFSGAVAQMTGTSRGTLSARRTRGSSASFAGRLDAAQVGPSDDFLSSLAGETGGTYTARATDFAGPLGALERANRTWYELTLAPSWIGVAGAGRLETRLPAHPDLTVVARPGRTVR